MTIKASYPTIEPTLSLDFANSKRLDPRVTFTRNSVGTYFDAAGVLRTAAVNEPRFDHNPATGESLGLLVEESRKNATTYSEDLSQWIISNMTATGNSIVLPNGAASTAVEYAGTDSTPNSKLVRCVFAAGDSAVSAGETKTLSLFLRAGTETSVFFVFQNATATEGTSFYVDLGTGTFPGAQNANGGATNIARTITKLNNGWYRVSATCTFSSDSVGVQGLLRLQLNSNSITATTSFSAWGSQLESGAFPTSYIKTEGSAVTRQADTAVMTGTNFSSWYRQDEGTLFAEFAIGQDSDGNRFFVNLDDGNNANGVDIRSSSIGTLRGVVASSASQQANLSLTSPAIGGLARSAVAYKVNDFAFSANGAAPAIDLGGDVGTGVNRLSIGSFGGVGNYSNTTIKRICFFSQRLSNATLQALTAS